MHTVYWQHIFSRWRVLQSLRGAGDHQQSSHNVFYAIQMSCWVYMSWGKLYKEFAMQTMPSRFGERQWWKLHCVQ